MVIPLGLYWQGEKIKVMDVKKDHVPEKREKETRVLTLTPLIFFYN